MNPVNLLLFLLSYAAVFLIVVWPLHAMWILFIRKERYDPRFHRQTSYWRLYFLVFGTALLIAFGLNLLHRP